MRRRYDGSISLMSRQHYDNVNFVQRDRLPDGRAQSLAVPAILVALSLVAFALNSLLTRAAIHGGHLDAPGFALVRIVTGALALAVLSSLRPQTTPRARTTPWGAAWALSGYLVAFTMAYTRIGAAAGALLLFGAVQVTMVAASLVGGERPSRADWLGGLLAVAGLLVLTVPGAAAPDPAGAGLMAVAGTCWGAYSVIGRGSAAPLADTGRNFRRAGALLAVPLAWLAWPPRGSATGVVLAALSGSVASGLGYTLWYAALPLLAAWRAAILQLFVPILAACGAYVFLDEPLTARMVLAGALVSAGVWVTSSPRWHPR
jgi:drug/metabolite transporter (DMT)-like permease